MQFYSTLYFSHEKYVVMLQHVNAACIVLFVYGVHFNQYLCQVRLFLEASEVRILNHCGIDAFFTRQSHFSIFFKD